MKAGAPVTVVRFSIDNGPFVTYTAPSLTVEGDGLLFFQSDPLSPGTHQIIANTTAATGDSPFFVDYLIVEPIGATLPSSTSSSPSSTASSTPSTSAPTSSGSSSTAAPAQTSGTTAGDNGNPQHKSSSAGPIAGGVVGGIAIIALILLGLFLWRRRRRNATFGYPDDIAPTPAMMDTAPVTGAGGAGVFPKNLNLLCQC